MSSPYTLPNGNVQIAFSGGRTSAYLLHEILDANGGLPDRAKVIFNNTGREMPETLNFVQECGARWGVHITWLEYRCRFTGAPHDPKNDVFDSKAHSWEVVSHNSADSDGKPFLELISYFKYPPNREADFCSHELKTRTARRYCVEALEWKNWTTAIGIRADEKRRALKKQPKERYNVWYPLIEANVSKRTVSDFWKTQPFDLELPNVNGSTWLGNCDGCFKKSQLKLAALAREYPERAQWWANVERDWNGQFREVESWDQLIDFIDRQGDWIFETEDALCQANDGECFG